MGGFNQSNFPYHGAFTIRCSSEGFLQGQGNMVKKLLGTREQKENKAEKRCVSDI